MPTSQRTWRLQVTGSEEVTYGYRTNVDHLDAESNPANNKNAEGAAIPWVKFSMDVADIAFQDKGEL
jgi:hypothetical protein